MCVCVRVMKICIHIPPDIACVGTSFVSCELTLSNVPVPNAHPHHPHIQRQKEVMVDASKKDYFIQWPNGSIYNQTTTIGSGLQYVWNFSNPAAADYVIASTLADLADPAVDGSYMDDGPYGMPLENPFIVQNINMSIATLAAYQNAAVTSYVKLVSGMVAAHKYSYQEMGWYGQYAAISQSQCSSFMRELCKPEMQNHPLMMHAQSAPGSTAVLNQTIAAFLIARPPVAFIGFPWSAPNRFVASTAGIAPVSVRFFCPKRAC